MSFFKPSVFIKTFLFFCAISATALFFSCKQLASFDPGVEGARVAVSNTISAPTGMKATNGLKQKISLTWTPVSGARYYEIYYAESATAEFKKVGETDKSSFDDKVGAGKTYYYKVCAVKSNGTQSPFSITTKGTSLAKPVIVGGDVKDYSVTISWFMENSLCVNGEDNYEESLKFDVCYKMSSDSDWKVKTIDASCAHSSFLNSYEYALTNLANAQSYQFCIKAYTIDKESNEASNVVDKTTMVSYIPLAPEIKASEGTSAKEISLNITLPPMVMVRTVTKDSNGEEKDVEFPLCFEISRKLESASEFTLVEKLYCNGTTSAPDYSNLKEAYKPDDVIEWIDEDGDLLGGEKYEYMVRSFVDIGYGKIVCPEGVNLVAQAGMFSKSVGWKSAPVVFEIERSKFENNGLTLSEDKTKICSVLFGFNMEWDDLGKASEYKFAIEQSLKPLTAEVSDSGVVSWLGKDAGSNFFETLEEINCYEIKFGSKNGLKENEKGFYSYTVYIVPKNAKLIEGKWDSVLDFKEADEVCVTDEVELPKAEFEVQGGYNDKVKLIISNFESDVRYVVTRTRLKDGIETSEKEPIVLNERSPDENAGEETFVYYDKDVIDNCRYSYVLEATASNGVCKKFEPQLAETLGTPKVSFESSKLDYDSFAISFENVLSANKYEITIGEQGGFANGYNLKFNMDEIKNSYDGTPIVIDDNGVNKAEISFKENKFTVVVKKPYGYDMPNLAGMYANASVKAFSDVDEAFGSTKVRVLGPALINAKGGDCTDKTITMTWNKVDGASGYLIYRIAYKDMDATQIESTDTLYYPATDDDITGSPSLTADGQISDKSILITKSGGKYTLQDTDTPATDTSSFQKSQSRISWGRPFGYIVLPVKDKDDFSFAPGTKTLADSAKVDYTKTAALAEVNGNTYGYGMNTAASKSDSIKDVSVEWVKPNVQTGLVPTLYRRAAGGTDGSFAKVKKAESLSATDTLEGDNKYEAFEYVVKYDTKEGGDTISVPASLLAELAAAKETRYTYPEGRTEPQNKGYALAVTLSAEMDKTNKYYERIDCDWDYKKRGIGPDKFTLSVYNNNIKDGWVDILSANGEKAFSVIDGVADIAIKTTDKRGVLSLAPQGIANTGAGTTDGMLKVLRDYKHYYKLKAERKDRNNALVTYETGNEKDVFAYREITDEELVRAATLVMTIGIKNSMPNSNWSRTGGTLQGGPSKTWNGIDGSSVYTKWNTWSNPVHDITFNNLGVEIKPKFGNSLDSYVRVDGNIKGSFDGGITSSHAPESYDGEITITNILCTETATLKFNSARRDSTDKLTLTRNGKSVTFGNITPLPYNSQGNNGYLDDNEEWQ